MGARLAKYLLGTTATVVGDLKLNSQMLHRIHDEFTDNAHRHKIRVHSFQEALPYPGLNRRVSMDRGLNLRLDYPFTKSCLDTDH